MTTEGVPDEVVNCLFCSAEVTLVFTVYGGFKAILEATCLCCGAYIWTEPALIGENTVDV